ncbi:hypothetical protein Droror1_Dr00018467 [Drosera rotundifolia]
MKTHSPKKIIKTGIHHPTTKPANLGQQTTTTHTSTPRLNLSQPSLLARQPPNHRRCLLPPCTQRQATADLVHQIETTTAPFHSKPYFIAPPSFSSMSSCSSLHRRPDSVVAPLRHQSGQAASSPRCKVDKKGRKRVEQFSRRERSRRGFAAGRREKTRG